jgi:hypothetical protein
VLSAGAKLIRWRWAESDRGGTRRRVRVRYPWAFPPGWGRDPLYVFAAGLCWLLCWAAAVATLAMLIGPGPLGHALHSLPLVWPIAALMIALPLRGLVMVVLAAPDMTARATIEGSVVRTRRCHTGHIYLAVDDGTRGMVRAWRLASVDPDDLTEGSVVRAVVSPRLRHVFSLQVLHRVPAATAPARSQHPRLSNWEVSPGGGKPSQGVAALVAGG